MHLYFIFMFFSFYDLNTTSITEPIGQFMLLTQAIFLNVDTIIKVVAVVSFSLNPSKLSLIYIVTISLTSGVKKLYN